jgi:hypothetical protein
MFASLTGTTMLKRHTNIRPIANKFQNAAPIDRAEQRSWTEGHTTGDKIGTRDPASKPGEPTHNQTDNRYIDTAGTRAEGREIALPYSKYANTCQTQKRAQAHIHTGKGDAKRQEPEACLEHRTHDTLQNGTDDNQARANTSKEEHLAVAIK